MELYTVTEVSKKLRVNKNYVYELISKGLIKSVKVGKIKIPSFELERFILDSCDGAGYNLEVVTSLEKKQMKAKLNDLEEENKRLKALLLEVGNLGQKANNELLKN